MPDAPDLTPPVLTRFASADAFAAALMHARLEGEVLGPSLGEWTLLRLRLPHGALQIGQNGARAMSMGVIHESGFTFGTVVEPRTPHFFNGHDLRSRLVMYREGSEFCGHSTSPSWWATVSFHADVLEQRHLAITGQPFPAIRGNAYVVEPAESHLESIRGLLRTVTRGVEQATLDLTRREALQSLEDGLLMSVTWALQAGRVVQSRDYRQRISIVRRACAALRAVGSEQPSLQEVCDTLGVNQRALFYAFREYLGMTPKRYLKVRRLTLVRHALLAGPEATVGEVASRHGFVEPGRFAAEYKTLFGESPSETLRRATRQTRQGAPVSSRDTAS